MILNRIVFQEHVAVVMEAVGIGISISISVGVAMEMIIVPGMED